MVDISRHLVTFSSLKSGSKFICLDDLASEKCEIGIIVKASEVTMTLENKYDHSVPMNSISLREGICFFFGPDELVLPLY